MKFGVIGLGWFVGFLMGFSVATVRITENITAFIDPAESSEVEGSVIEPVDDRPPAQSPPSVEDSIPKESMPATREGRSGSDVDAGVAAESIDPKPAKALASDTAESELASSSVPKSADASLVTTDADSGERSGNESGSEAQADSAIQEGNATGEVLAEAPGIEDDDAKAQGAVGDAKTQDIAWTRDPDSLIDVEATSSGPSASETEKETGEATEWSVDTSAVEGGFQAVGFDFLAGFNYEVSDEFLLVEEEGAPSEGPEIPKRVLELNQRPVAVTGFMMPLKVVEDDKVSEFLLLRSAAMCCYGEVPEVNEWISVTMTGKPTTSVMDRPVQVRGTLRVGEMREDGYLVGIYEMDGESLEIVAHEVD